MSDLEPTAYCKICKHWKTSSCKYIPDKVFQCSNFSTGVEM